MSKRAMSKISGRRSLTAILSLLTIGAALCFGAATAFAGDNKVTEDQIVRALAPARKPLTRGLSVGRPAGRSGGDRRRGAFRSDHPRPGDAFALDHRARGNRHHRQGQAEYRSGNHLRLQFGRYQRQVAALGPGARKGADQSRPEGLDLHRRRSYRRGRRRGLQSGPVRAARRLDQALSGRQVRHRPRHRRLWQEQAQGSGQPDGGSQPPGAGRQHGEQDHRVPVNGQVNGSWR